MVVDPTFLNLLRINFFMDPPDDLPWTVEAELLGSPLFRELGGELFEIDPELRRWLLVSLQSVYRWERTERVALLLERYSDLVGAWSGEPYLAQAQRLTALSVLHPAKALRWLDDVQTDVTAQVELSPDWFVAMRGRLEAQPVSTVRLDGEIGAAAQRLRLGDSAARADLTALGLLPGSDVAAVSVALRSAPGSDEELQLLERLRGLTAVVNPLVQPNTGLSATQGQMRVVDVEIFEQASTYIELHLSEDGGPQATRGMDRASVDALAEAVDRDYRRDTVAQRVFASPLLAELGARLFDFLDGDQRWLTSVLRHPPGSTLRITTADKRLRQLPWELLATGGSYLAVAAGSPVLPVRVVGTHARLPADTAAGNRPLRVLFMATSPEHVEPVLNFEAEEAAILAATSRTGAELVVEESGTLDGLRALMRDYGDGYFDVLHLSGHATLTGIGPGFVVEDEFGAAVAATADQIAQALSGTWPRLVFVSGSGTAHSPDSGAFPSMSESLVRAGAPTVLGWALPVGDTSATDFAAKLYESLADGGRLDWAVIEARRHLYRDEKSPNWHLLRVFADRSPLSAMVTPLNTMRRQAIRVRAADQAFLDPQTGLSRVASRSTFVGRRRVIQRCLRALNQPADTAAGALVLHGMEGLGKSSLASRLLERMPTHQRAVWYGRVDAIKLRELLTKIRFSTLDQQVEATKILDTEQIPLARRLQFLLDADGPLGRTPCLFVFDDFEDGNLDERDGSHVLAPQMADILPALLTAIDETGSRSRVIITSRYRFPTPAGTRVTVESLETLTPVEQTKKISNLANLRPGSHLDREIRRRAIAAADGNPGLLDRIDRIVADTTLDVDALLTAIENETIRFRENILAKELLDSQDPELRHMLATVSVVELPIPAETVHAVHGHPDTTRYLTRAVQLGLIEEGTDPTTRRHRYYVSNVLRPLLSLTDDEHIRACAAAARSLGELGFGISAGHGEEVHRLAVSSGETLIARDIGSQMARLWLPRSRFADVEAIATATLTLGPDAGAFYDRGWARRATGRPRPALDDYQQAIDLYREAGDRGNEAATLTNIGLVYDGLGDRQRALDFYQQALPIRREVGDRAGEATTLTNIGLVYDGLGDRQRALDFYQQALPIRREVGDRAGEATTLTNIGLVYDGLGDRQRALDFYQQALPIRREVGDRAGEATTLTNIGLVYDGLGDRQRALDFYQQALPIRREVGDRAGEATTLTNIGLVYDGLGDRQRALDFYQQALPIRREVGDRAGEATTLTNIGLVYDGLGDRQRALDFYQQALPIRREVGDRAGEATTRYNIAMIHRAGGDLVLAVGELERVVDLDRQVEHPDLAGDTAMLEQVRHELTQARARG
ncbi:tetratricopeptide repeat protein [Actinoplanes derwentensis]|uniref:tetratricopeptide repeat protein n=2 Tax=Actinoplanes derwentensis TaxID=113562 RepID=UPI001E500117|nr:tetratricopeptide repeat protein [Actinoplanes derwentensis]